jgi:hypothetical protein
MIRLSRSVLAVVVTATLSAAGCQREGTDSERVGAGPASGEEADERTRRQGAPPPTVELLSPGAEPRRALRYALTPGARERVVIELDMELAMALADAPSPPVQLPRMQMVLDLDIEELASEEAADGVARYTFELSEARTLASDGVDPTVLRAIEQGLVQTIGTRGSAVVDARGVSRDTRIDIPAGAPPETRQMMETTAQQMEQLASPLPAEPVGEGARWEITQHLEQNGISIVQTSVMTLASLDGQTGRLEASIRQEAEPQVVQMPGAMAGARAELLELRSRGEGIIDFDLARLMPVRGEMRSESETRLQLDVGGGEAQPMTMHMELGLSLAGQ